MSVFQSEVLNLVQAAREGRIQQLPLHLQRMNDHVSLRKNIYTLVGGNTGEQTRPFKQ